MSEGVDFTRAAPSSSGRGEVTAYAGVQIGRATGGSFTLYGAQWVVPGVNPVLGEYLAEYQVSGFGQFQHRLPRGTYTKGRDHPTGGR